jgi:hypothetical protein
VGLRLCGCSMQSVSCETVMNDDALQVEHGAMKPPYQLGRQVGSEHTMI